MANATSDGTAAALETPSGKGAGDENFPVGSWLLPAALRPHVAAFYAFVRAADDVGDNPDRSRPTTRSPDSTPSPMP